MSEAEGTGADGGQDPEDGGGGPDPEQLTPEQEQMLRQMEEEMRRVRVQDLVAQSVVSIINLAYRRIAKEDERDLEQARVGIEAVRGMVGAARPRSPSTDPQRALAAADALRAAVRRGRRGRRARRRARARRGDAAGRRRHRGRRDLREGAATPLDPWVRLDPKRISPPFTGMLPRLFVAVPRTRGGFFLSPDRWRKSELD